MVVPRVVVVLACALFVSLVQALNLSVSGSPELGQPITLTWDGVSPWTLDIFTAAPGATAFTLYKSFTPITVNSGIWHVDVAAGTLVEFIVTDTTGSSGTQDLQIDNGGAGVSTSSIAAVSSVSAQSTKSTASLSSVSTASTSSLTTTSTTSTTSAVTTTSITSLPTKTRTPTPSPSVSSLSSSTTLNTAGPISTDLPSQSGHTSGSSAGAVAGGVIGIILSIMLLATIYWLCRRQRQRQLTEAYPYTEHESSASNEKFGGHRRTLSRGQPQSLNSTPKQPHLSLPLNAPGGTDFFAAAIPTRESPRASSVLRQFGEFITTPSAIPDNSLSLELAPRPAPVAAARPSVLDIARSAQKNDIPLYTPTSIQRPTFGRDQTAHPQTERGDSPFADGFVAHGHYEPEVQDPAVTASYATATLPPAPRPSRPDRPARLGLEGAVVADALAPAQNRNSVSQVGPVPTVGHSRKISGPIPFVFPNARSEETRVPSWALNNEEGRYPVIMVQTPSTASTIVGASAGAGGMAGVGAGLSRSMSGSLGRPIYPAAALGPRQPQKRSSSQPQPSINRPAGPRSPPTNSRSPPIGSRSPPIVPRAQAMSPPPVNLSPLTPPRRLNAEPDVPVTPITPNLSAFPSPPRTLAKGGSLSSLEFIADASAGAVGGSSPSVGKGRSLQPITTILPYQPGGPLSPIAASPIPTPLASSTIASPYASRFTPAPTLTRDDTVSSRITTSTAERMILRRELQQDAQSEVQTVPQTPSTPEFNPNGITNFQTAPPMLSLPASFSPTFKSPVQERAAEQWYEGRHISLAPTTGSNRQSSAASARRLSDITSGDAEWKELESQLKWLNDEAHVMPRPAVP